MNTKTLNTGCGQLTQTSLKSFFPFGLMCAVLLGALFAATAHAADGTPVWTNYFNGTGNGDDQASVVTVDGSGNVIVTGYSYGSGYDYATIKYSSAGVPLWTNRFNGAGNSGDVVTSMTVDGVGNVIVTGYATGSGSGFDCVTIKYSSAGVPLWTNLFNDPGNYDDNATSLAVDGSGNVIVTGSAPNGFPNGQDYLTIKYSSAGVPLWTNFFNSANFSSDFARCLAMDSSGNVIVSGYSHVSGSSYDYATVKYSSAGVPVWTNLFNGVGNSDDFVYSVAVDGSGNAIVTGYSYASGGVNSDYATIKYSSAGVPLWTNLFNGAGNNNDAASSVAVDGSGNVIVTGFATAVGFDFNYATIKYSSAGTPLWTNLFNRAGNNDDAANSLAVDGSGNVIVTGYSYSPANSFDFATIKYSGIDKPVISVQPVNQMVALTSNAIFSVTASGAAPLAYQWYLNGASLAGRTNSALTVSNVAYANQGGSYQVIITNVYGAVTSSVAVLTISNLPFQLPGDKGKLGFANKQFYLTVIGPAGSNAVISASTNLLSWVPLVTNPLTIGSIMFTDALSTNFMKRFYRANLQ